VPNDDDDDDDELYISYEVTSEMFPSEAVSMKGVLNKS
jgi:hypothetical protein